MHSRHILCMATLAALSCVAPAQITNVALGKPVSEVVGTVNGPLAVVTDGVFMPRGTSWDVGSVYWFGLHQVLEVDLQGRFTIESMIFQGDDNDAFQVTYKDGADPWLTAWDVPNYDAYGSGLQTRPNPADDNERYMLPAPIVATNLRIQSVSGDTHPSVSELQAFGELVPEPASIAALGLGIFVLIRGRKA